jgi:energy-converting hydrogenase Eha subunit E
MLGVRAIGICIGALLNSSSVALILFSAAAATSSVFLMAMVTVADRKNPTATAKRGEN